MPTAGWSAMQSEILEAVQVVGSRASFTVNINDVDSMTAHHCQSVDAWSK